MSSLCGTENTPAVANSNGHYYTTHSSLTLSSQLRQQSEIKLDVVTERVGDKVVKYLKARIEFPSDFCINFDSDFFYLLATPDTNERAPKDSPQVPERGVQRSLSDSS